MKISRIKVKNYRSIRSAEINVTDFNVLVGQNNHGKTNFFDAIKWFYTPSGNLESIKNSIAHSDEHISVEIEFTGVQQGLKQISNSANKTKLQKILGDSDTMRIRRTSDALKERHLYNPEDREWKKQPCGADSAFNNCIPRFEFVEATKNLKDVGNYKSNTPIGKMLGGVLSELLVAEEEYVRFREQFERLFGSESSRINQKLREVSNQVCKHLEKQFPDCSEVRFEVEEPAFDDLLKNFKTEVDDGVKTNAEEKGDGMQRALMLAIIKTYADVRRDDSLGRSFIFFIDEAELHLHPTAQRQLKQALRELADGHDQIFINTHSSVLLSDEDANQSIFRVAKANQGETELELIASNARKHEVIFELLGGSPADILLPANFLVVEGASEQEFLQQVIKRHYSDKPPIQILPAGGDDERQRQITNGIAILLASLDRRPIYRKRLGILFDQPDGNEKQKRFEAFKSSRRNFHSEKQLFVIPEHGLEDYYPNVIRSQYNITKKTLLAKKIGLEITKEQFESDMNIMHQALEYCWANAY